MSVISIKKNKTCIPYQGMLKSKLKMLGEQQIPTSLFKIHQGSYVFMEIYTYHIELT